LADAGVATDEQVRDAIAEGMQTGERLGEVVLRKGWTDESGLARLLAEQSGLRFIESEALSPEQAALALLSAEDARSLGAVAISIEESGPLVAIAEPSEERLAAVNASLAGEASFVVVARSALDLLLVRAPPAGHSSEPMDSGDGRHAALLADLDASVARLAGLRQNVERLTRTLRSTEQELSQCQGQLVAVSAAHERERAQRQHLEAELERRSQRLFDTRATLAELLRELEDG
jgi:hypothetical protein